MTRYNTKEQQKLIDDTREEIRLHTNKMINKEAGMCTFSGKCLKHNCEKCKFNKL